jgi:acetolactate synthase-1/2/3 large subunit
VALNAASGYAIVSGKPSAVAVHVDVGTLHMGAAIHAAWHDRAPVLIMAGAGPRAFPGAMRGGRDIFINWVQEPRDQAGIVRQYTKLDHRLEHEDNPGLMVSRLLQVAQSEPKGPVYLTIPRETAMLPLSGGARFPTCEQMGLARPSWPDPDDARTLARWLVKAENPVLFTARLGEDPAAIDEYVRLAELLAIPVMESSPLATRMNFPATHPLYGVGPSAREADVVLVVEDLTPFTPGIDSPAASTKVAWVSSDPVLSRYKTMEYRADLWLTAAPVNVARAVAEEAAKMLDRSDLSRIAARRARLEEAKQRMLADDEREAARAGQQPVPNGRWLGHQLGQVLDPEAILINDVVSSGHFVRNYARRNRPGSYLRTGSSAGGWGSGVAVGAKLARPDRDVVLASGDGFFAFGSPLSALWAARFHKAPFLSVVFVNGWYSTGTSAVKAMYPKGDSVQAENFAGGVFDPVSDFAKLAETAGGYGENVTETAQVGPALKRGLNHVREGVPAVIAVRITD